MSIFSCLLPWKNYQSLSCISVSIIKTSGHGNLPRVQDGHKAVCSIKKGDQLIGSYQIVE